MKQYVVIGIGRFGGSVARNLAALGQEVLAVDENEERVKNIAQYVTHAVQADTTDTNALKALGINQFDVGVVAIGEDLQASIMTTLLLKELGVPHVVAKASNKLQGRVLNKIGADRVIFPERAMGKRVAHNLVSSGLLDYIELAKDYRIDEIVAPNFMVGKTLRDLNLRNRFGISVIVVKRSGGDEIVVSPSAETAICKGDTMVVIGKNDELNRLNRQMK